MRPNMVYNRVLTGAAVLLALVFICASLHVSSRRVSARNQQGPIPSRYVSIAFSNKRNNGVWAAVYAETYEAANAEAIRACESKGGVKCGVMMGCAVRPPVDPRRFPFVAFARDSFVGFGGNKNLACEFASMKEAEAKAMQGACDPAVSPLEWGPCTIVWSAKIYP